MAVVNLDDPSDVAAWNRRAPAPAPTDAEIDAIADQHKASGYGTVWPHAFARAVLAKWGAPAPASQPVAVPAGMQPVASESLVKWASLIELAQTDWHTGYEAARAYVKVQLECATPQPAAPRNATLYNPDDVAFPIQRSADGVDALSPELASTARPASIAAVEVAAPSVPARAPHDHIEDVRAMVQIAVEADEVLLALKRPEGYEDVHPELVAADALSSTPFDYRVAWPLEVDP